MWLFLLFGVLLSIAGERHVYASPLRTEAAGILQARAPLPIPNAPQSVHMRHFRRTPSTHYEITMPGLEVPVPPCAPPNEQEVANGTLTSKGTYLRSTAADGTVTVKSHGTEHFVLTGEMTGTKYQFNSIANDKIITFPSGAQEVHEVDTVRFVEQGSGLVQYLSINSKYTIDAAGVMSMQVDKLSFNC